MIMTLMKIRLSTNFLEKIKEQIPTFAWFAHVVADDFEIDESEKN